LTPEELEQEYQTGKEMDRLDMIEAMTIKIDKPVEE
jgi:hypothetical protein